MSAPTPPGGQVGDGSTAEAGSLAEQAGRLAEELWHRWASHGGLEGHQDGEGRHQDHRGEDRQSDGHSDAKGRSEPSDDGERPGHACAEDAGDAGDGWGGGAACQLCPLCRVIDQVRQSRPELVGQLATVAQGVADLLRDLAGSQAAGDASTRADAEPGEGTAGPGDRGIRIDVVDDEPDATGGTQP